MFRNSYHPSGSSFWNKLSSSTSASPSGPLSTGSGTKTGGKTCEGSLNGNKFISHSSGDKFKITVSAWSDERSLLGRRLLIVSSHGGRIKTLLWRLSFCKMLISFITILPPWFKHLPKVYHLLIPLHWATRFHYINFGGHKHSDHNTVQICYFLTLNISIEFFICYFSTPEFLFNNITFS